MKQVSLYLAVALSIAGCGGSPSKKLSTDQKQQLSSVVNAWARTGTVSKSYADKVNNNVRNKNTVGLRALIMGQLPGFTAGQNMGQTMNMLKGDKNSPALNFGSNDNGSVSSSNNSSTNSSSANDNLAPMEEQLDGNCEAEFKQPDTSIMGQMRGVSQDTPDYKLNVYGLNCPIDFHFDLGLNVKSSKTKNSFSATLATEYKVKTDDFRKLNDVDAFKIDMTISGTANQDGSGKLNATLDGFINSQSEGRVDMSGRGSVSGSANGGSGEFTLDLKMKSFTAEFKLTARTDKNGQPVAEITLNGERLSDEDLQKLFDDGYVLGQDVGTGIGSSHSSSGNSQSSGGNSTNVGFPTNKSKH